jgi:uncharacterized protein YacL
VIFTLNFYSRLVGAILLAYAGWSFGIANSPASPTPTQQWATTLLMLSGAALGLIVTPYVTVVPIRRLLARVRGMTFVEFVASLVGLLVGLLASVLVTVPVAHLPGIMGSYGPTVVAVVLTYLGISIARVHRQDLQALLRLPARQRPAGARNRRTLVDTSIIIDGRIGDVIKTGFVSETLLVPRFVLRELQHLADSADELTRAKGKRGLDTLRVLQDSQHIQVKISDTDIPGVRDVDDKLVALARIEQVPLLTNDMNLEHVAQLQGVTVLNLNKLADAIRIPFSTGERITVTIRSEGREREQGVGFSNDGTMIVVEDARNLIGQEVSAVVTRVYTTQTGRIIFAQMERRDAVDAPPERSAIAVGRGRNT